MIKDRKRIVNTFTKYARLGLAAKRLDAFEVYRRIRGSSRTRAEAYELLAVCDTIRYLRISGKEEALNALYEVYFPRISERYSKSEINGRVVRYALRHGCDERTVYRRLAYVIKVYCAALESYEK